MYYTVLIDGLVLDTFRTLDEAQACGDRFYRTFPGCDVGIVRHETECL
jgi:hypothetical protein